MLGVGSKYIWQRAPGGWRFGFWGGVGDREWGVNKKLGGGQKKRDADRKLASASWHEYVVAKVASRCDRRDQRGPSPMRMHKFCGYAAAITVGTLFGLFGCQPPAEPSSAGWDFSEDSEYSEDSRYSEDSDRSERRRSSRRGGLSRRTRDVFADLLEDCPREMRACDRDEWCSDFINHLVDCGRNRRRGEECLREVFTEEVINLPGGVAGKCVNRCDRERGDDDGGRCFVRCLQRMSREFRTYEDLFGNDGRCAKRRGR
ncbi:MAG: hypothetical protein FWD57_09700 [Polyangiaceae bacterium]|nr:hypothetical protein [Polyangiaceae bacterium]